MAGAPDFGVVIVKQSSKGIVVDSPDLTALDF
jgi:NADPH-dependent 7-cyano-7-deazaguanine reductase QueF